MPTKCYCHFLDVFDEVATLETLPIWSWPWWITFQLKIDSFISNEWCRLLQFTATGSDRLPTFSLHSKSKQMEVTMINYETDGTRRYERLLSSVNSGRWYFVKTTIEKRAVGPYHIVLYIDGIEIAQKILWTDSNNGVDVIVKLFGPGTACLGSKIKNLNYGCQREP